ncbi:hypothetical protein FRC19_007024 [Serendipita sp. 401]|nr:hypothetical protein FRC19_007024 [Serendipita sp. 401]
MHTLFPIHRTRLTSYESRSPPLLVAHTHILFPSPERNGNTAGAQLATSVFIQSSPCDFFFDLDSTPFLHPAQSLLGFSSLSYLHFFFFFFLCYSVMQA